MALIDEVCELCKELEWRTWRVREDADPQLVANEFADILAFMGVMVIYLKLFCDLSADDLANAYLDKTAINLKRIAGQVEGFGAEP